MPLDAQASRRAYKILAFLAGPEPVGDDERKALDVFAAAHGLPADELSALHTAGQSKESLETPSDDAEQTIVIDAMIELIAADGVLDHHEQERLLTLANDLSISQKIMRARLLDRLMGG